MRLTPQERDKLMIFVAAQVARERKKRGLKLNLPEATALITAELMEMARDGKTRGRDHECRPRDPEEGRRDGRRRGDDLDDPGRADLPRRQQAGHRPRSDSLANP